MPNAPNLEGLPPTAQFVFLGFFMLLTAMVALKGYFKKQEGHVHSSVAHLADMGPVRRLADVVLDLDSGVKSLDRAVTELTHHIRIRHEDEQKALAAQERLIHAVKDNTKALHDYIRLMQQM